MRMKKRKKFLLVQRVLIFSILWLVVCWEVVQRSYEVKHVGVSHLMSTVGWGYDPRPFWSLFFSSLARIAKLVVPTPMEKQNGEIK